MNRFLNILNSRCNILNSELRSVLKLYLHFKNLNKEIKANFNLLKGTYNFYSYQYISPKLDTFENLENVETEVQEYYQSLTARYIQEYIKILKEQTDISPYYDVINNLDIEPQDETEKLYLVKYIKILYDLTCTRQKRTKLKKCESYSWSIPEIKIENSNINTSNILNNQIKTLLSHDEKLSDADKSAKDVTEMNNPKNPKNTQNLSEFVKVLKNDINEMHNQVNKSDMYALYYSKVLEDLAKFEESTLSVDNFYKNFKCYLSEAIEKEMSVGNPDYSVEAGLQSALDLLEWYYLKCQNTEMPFEYNSKIFRNTVQLKTLLDNFVQNADDVEISTGVKARMEIVIKILDGMISDLLNPTEDVSDTYDRFDDQSDSNITYPNIDDPDDLEDLDPSTIFSVEQGTKDNTTDTEDTEDTEDTGDTGDNSDTDDDTSNSDNSDTSDTENPDNTDDTEDTKETE
jgi:hypothetical protein